MLDCFPEQLDQKQRLSRQPPRYQGAPRWRAQGHRAAACSRGAARAPGRGARDGFTARLLSPSAPAGLQPAPGNGAGGGGGISPFPRQGRACRAGSARQSGKARPDPSPAPEVGGPGGVPGAGPGLGERVRSHLSRPRAAAGRLSGHFFRNVNHALTYYINPLIAKDAFRVGGRRAVTPPPRGAPAPLLCRRMR